MKKAYKERPRLTPLLLLGFRKRKESRILLDYFTLQAQPPYIRPTPTSGLIACGKPDADEALQAHFLSAAFSSRQAPVQSLTKSLAVNTSLGRHGSTE